MVIWLWFGCAGEPEGGAEEATTGAEDPSPYIYDEVEGEDTPYDQAAIEEAMETAFTEVLRYDASPVLDGYSAAMEEASEDCPDYYSDDGNVYWYDNCTSSRGATFNGYSFYYLYEQYPDGDYTWDGPILYAEASVQTADGRAFEGGGSALRWVGRHADGWVIYYSYVAGTFAWDGDEATGTWLGEGVRAEIGMWVQEFPGYDYNYAYVSGGVSGLPAAHDTVAFTDVSISTPALGWPCAGEVAGTVSVRAEDGTWFDVVFDVDADTWTVDEAACDGCGEVWHRGEVVGEACPDPSALIAWGEGGPW